MIGAQMMEKISIMSILRQCKTTSSQKSYTGFLPRGGGGGGQHLRQFAPPKTFAPPEIWSENNSITVEICMTIDFALPLKTVPRRKPATCGVNSAVETK